MMPPVTHMDSNAPSLLIVTPEPLLGGLLSKVLDGHGYRCLTETEPAAARARFGAEQPSLTMIDLGGLQHDGLELLADIRRQHADAVVIALIGTGQSDLEAAAYALGVTDIVRRHEDLAQTLALIDRLDDEKTEGAPQKTRESLPAAGDSRSEPPILDEPTTVLVVDDDSTVSRFLEHVLTRDGYIVLTAGDGLEALDVLDRREDVRLMFLDLRLPHLGGLGVLRRLQDRPSRPRIVIISGVADDQLKQDAIQLGAFDYLQKPLTVDRVLVTASTAVVLDRARGRSFWSRWMPSRKR